MALPILEEYWGGVVRRLQTEVEVFNRLIGHQAEMGRENELSLVRLLENLLPANLGVGSGIVIDSSGGRSQQNDIVLFDRASQPAVMAQTSQTLFPVEVVKSVIEVKTTLSPTQLRDCGKKRKSLADLKAIAGFSQPSFYVFAYSYSAQPANLASSLLELDSESRPDAICVVSPGLLAEGRITPEIGLVFLHELDESGARVGGTPKTLPTLSADARYHSGASTYPVTRTPDGKFVAGEPGRALLLFCDLLLTELSKIGAIPTPVLSGYLDTTARERLSVAGPQPASPDH